MFSHRRTLLCGIGSELPRETRFQEAQERPILVLVNVEEARRKLAEVVSEVETLGRPLTIDEVDRALRRIERIQKQEQRRIWLHYRRHSSVNTATGLSDKLSVVAESAKTAIRGLSNE